MHSVPPRLRSVRLRSARLRSALGSAAPASLLAGLLALAACGGSDVSRTFGLTRDAPDEFTVTTRAPLSMPPDYALRPPRPGAPRPQEQSPRRQAEAALAPTIELGAGAGTASAGQQALVAAAGPAAPADIRRRVEAEAALDQPSRSFTDRLMFWNPKPPPGTVVDPQRESQRLRENAALGRTVESGETPIIQRTKPSFLSTLF